MNSKERIVLQKMIAYAGDALLYLGNMPFDVFMKDRKTVSACAFCLGQIGELVSHVSLETQSKYGDIPWRSIKGLRNRIIHDYDNVDMIVVWRTIRDSLPDLIISMEQLLLSGAIQESLDLDDEMQP